MKRYNGMINLQERRAERRRLMETIAADIATATRTIENLLSIDNLEQFKQVVQQQGPSMPVGFYGKIVDNLNENDPRHDFVMDLMVQKYV